MGCTACTEPQCLYKGALKKFIGNRISISNFGRKSSMAATAQLKKKIYIYISDLMLEKFGVSLWAKRKI